MTAFTSFGFKATGGTTDRTMPDRLVEIRNVLDYGADSTGTNDCAASIQAAVDAAIAAGGGTIYFPLGSYKVLSAIAFNAANLSLCFRGEGNGSTISGNFNGFLLDRHLASPSNTARISIERLNLTNGNSSGATSGALRIGSAKQVIIRDVAASGFVCITMEDSAGNSSQNIFIESCKIQSSTSGAGTIGLIIGGGGAMIGTDFVATDIGVIAYGNGLNIAGCRNEGCNIGYQLGLDSAGTNAGMSGFSIISSSTEGCLTGIDFAGTCIGGFLGAVSALGHITSGPLEDTPSQYGLRIRADCAQACTFHNISAQSYFTIAAISIANAGARANNVFVGCKPTAFGGGVPWILPTNAYTARFVQCTTNPVWTYSQLPSGGNVLEGDEFNISDGNSATWGANVTAGSGTNHILARWNGSNWTVVGK